MKLSRNTFTSFALGIWLFLSPACFAANQFESLTVGYSSFSGAYVPLWLAVEERLGRKHGLDLKAIYAGRIRPQQRLASGEVPYVIATGTGALTSSRIPTPESIKTIRQKTVKTSFESENSPCLTAN